MAGRDLGNRITEYVDSSRMTNRIKIRHILRCRIQGHYGIYSTTVDLSKKATKTKCSCPSEYWPCKHAHALADTYEVAPETFVDVKEIIKELRGKNKVELLRIIEKMALSAPESLAALGIKGFDETEEEDEE